MANRCRILTIVYCLTFYNLLGAQRISRYNTFSYSVNEGLLQTTIADMEFDQNNYCWISFPNGIQQFDGNHFTNVKVQAGLPDDKSVTFFRCSNGDLLISHSQGVSKYEIGRNRFIHVYKQSLPLQKPVLFLGETNGVIYFYDESATITGINNGTYKVVNTSSTGFEGYGSNAENIPRISDNIIGNNIALCIKSTLYLWSLPKGKMVFPPMTVPHGLHFFLRLRSSHEVWYNNYTNNNALQCWDFELASNKTFPVKGKDDKVISRCIIYPWHDKTLVAFNNQLFETDPGVQTLRSELVNFQNQPVAGSLAISQIREDNFGNLYLQTVTGGIKKIIRNNYPVKYYGIFGQEATSVLSVLPDKKNNRVLVGTNGNGLLIFDTLQHLVKQIRVLPGVQDYVSISAIIKDNKGNYLLFPVGEKKAWRLNPDLTALTSSPFLPSDSFGISRVEYFSEPLFQDGSRAIIQSMHHIYDVIYAKPTIAEHIFSNEYILSGLWLDSMIITHGNGELIFLDGQTFKPVKKIPFAHTGGVRCFARNKDGNILVGSNKGIFKIDVNGKIIRQWNKENGLPDECIYAITIDDNGSLWCSSNKGIFRINTNNNIMQLTKEDGLQENEFNTNVVAQAEDGEIFFGGANGVSSFFPSAIGSFDEKINILFTRVRVNNADIEMNTAVWNIEKIKLPYNQNSLSFDFVAMANNNPAQYTYQYKMDGIDEEWLQNTGMQTVRYSLPPGKYILQVYASRYFDKGVKPMKEIRIIIKPPFWKTWWFFTVISLLFIFILVYSINQRIKRKYLKKLHQLENERQLKLERERISKDLHDSLGAYANAVLYNTDLLEKEKGEQKRIQLIGDLKFASKDIITSLRETVWALKKESYTAEDCLLRIRNFIHPFTRYYEHINFRVTGEAPQNRILHYAKALNLVRIVQEAVSNSIKHAHPANIIISSEIQLESWKIRVVDDGRGFDYELMKEQDRGNGLNNIEQRAAESGFTLSILTSEKKGTEITVIV